MLLYKVGTARSAIALLSLIELEKMADEIRAGTPGLSKEQAFAPAVQTGSGQANRLIPQNCHWRARRPQLFAERQQG